MQGVSDLNRELLDAAALCRQLVAEGSVAAFLADHRQELFPDAMFEDLFASRRGRPSIPGDVVATVMVLQSLEGFSDREAAHALTNRIDWKVACGLALTDAAFDYSVLTYWRSRLRNSTRPERIFDAVREVVAATGVLKAKTRRALDSTVLDDAVATQDTVTQLVAQLRRVKRLVGEASALEARVPDDGRAKPLADWSDAAARATLVDELVADARDVLAVCAGLELTEDQNSALGLLGLVAGQDVERGEDGTWRIARKVAKDRVVSTVDAESRHTHKSRVEHRDGYKAHVAVEPETGIVTACALSAGNVPDAKLGPELLAAEPTGLTVYADTAYASGDSLAALQDAGHATIIKPWPISPAIEGGFHRDDFAVDEAAGTVTCPAQHTVRISARRHANFGVRCSSCALRARCTSASGGRKVSLLEHDALLVANRERFRDPSVVSDYRKWRPMVERSLSWLARGPSRRLRYRGLARNQQGLSTRVAAINLRRLINLGLDYDEGWVLAT